MSEQWTQRRNRFTYTLPNEFLFSKISHSVFYFVVWVSIFEKNGFGLDDCENFNRKNKKTLRRNKLVRLSELRENSFTDGDGMDGNMRMCDICYVH